MEKSKGKIQVGIYTIAILMMGVVGIASSLSVIGSHFPDLSQTEVQSLISIPCIVIIPVTLLVGALMKTMSKKLLSLIGVVLFLVGGVGPAFSESFLIIQILRGVFGAGVGILQVVSTALVAENFEGAMRDKVQGNLQVRRRLDGNTQLERRVLCSPDRCHHRCLCHCLPAKREACCRGEGERCTG